MSVVDRLIGRLAAPDAALRRAIRLSEQGKAAEAFPLLTLAARAGIPDAEYRVARCYLEGSGVPHSQTEGARWLQRAAAHGCVEAQSWLAALYLHGFAGAVGGGALEAGPRAGSLFATEAPSDPDFNSAFKWACQAAEAGSPSGQALLAYILTYGPESMRHLDTAHRWYERSAAAGCPEGNLGYALSLAQRANSDEDRRQVADQLRRAAEAELPTAIYLLGVLTEQGLG